MPPDPQLALFADLPPAPRRSGRSRLFFALWPEAPLRAALAGVAAMIPIGDSANAYRVRPERYHLTLAFLGELDAQQVAAASLAGDAVASEGFTLRLDHVGHFAGANVVWLGPDAVPPALAQLKARLDRELLHVALPVDAVAYRPHITLLRKVREPPDAQIPPMDWRVRDFVLVRSARHSDGRPAGYKLLRRWPLASPSG